MGIRSTVHGHALGGVHGRLHTGKSHANRGRGGTHEDRANLREGGTGVHTLLRPKLFCREWSLQDQDIGRGITLWIVHAAEVRG